MESNTYFQGCNFNGCDLSGAIMRHASFEATGFDDADFSKADLSGGDFYLVHSYFGNFEGAILRNAKFSGGSFNDTSFVGADLTGASFLEDNMGGAVNLCDVDFTNANLTGVIFGAAFYNDNTKFPEGFVFDKPGLSKGPRR